MLVSHTQKTQLFRISPTPLLMYELSETSRRKWTKQAANQELSDTHGRQKSLEHHIQYYIFFWLHHKNTPTILSQNELILSLSF